MTDIAYRQNKQDNIQKLKAQRQMYSDIKRWMIVNLMIGVVTPLFVSILVFVFNNNTFSSTLGFESKDISYISAPIGIMAAISVVVISQLTKRMKETSAKIQETFDTSVFKLEWDKINVGEKPDFGIILKNCKTFEKKHPNYAGFEDWYTIKAATFKYPQAIAFCQQQNLNWDSELRQQVVKIATITLFTIVTFIFVLGILNDFTLRALFTNILSLLLPVFLFFYKMIAEQKDTIKEMSRLKDINRELIGFILSNDLSSEDFTTRCRQLQTAIYHHRKSARPTPNWLHKRNKNEQEDESAKRMQKYLDDYQS
ncbi:S-4TM family putative pore-forming effector [Psychrobacter sp. DM8]|uniref:S-4TM family putative pore-forming effector n=1 Tax=Psychrobacter sp. DM8 TaxID=3440636 RepID=UPI003F502C97